MHEKVLFVSNIRKDSTEIQGKVHRKKIIFYVKFLPVKVNWFQDERRSDKRRSGQTQETKILSKVDQVFLYR